MRIKMWSFDNVLIDLEDRDVSVKAVHALNGTEITVAFRLGEKQVRGEAGELRKRIEILAADRLLDLASFLDSF
ncbi:MAG: hypothetical protein KJ871_15080 [Alphaproteobacteria bacterium]|uniref:hypothetical protein n=1 Tax=Hyphomonas sp. TaxID=87 RepID=UPI001E066B11|nr:hypothetical protein [Alphaproteobacteria bacterium]MBU2085315.1 hypothetical protein [Alphaproteobacteria bacterium]MBU2142583.1 hypothetical protein [Alphaproteobacteria bacterium]MBU2196196.1 hypothetical protein [Alphaproteobacteria bacterium]